MYEEQPTPAEALDGPSPKTTVSRLEQGFNCQGQLMRATLAPFNLQGQRRPVINCSVHKCK